MKWLIALVLSFSIIPPLSKGDTLHVSAAISMKESLEGLIPAYESKTGTKIDLSLGASGMLATQIANGAEIDLFISAAQKQVDDLAKKNLIDPQSRVVVARNALSLITPKGGVPMNSFDDLKEPEIRRIAAGEPKVVPAGYYAKQVLDHLNLSDTLKEKLVFGANVRQVLAYVSGGEVDAGLVYRTDAISAGDKVTIVADADPTWAKPIEYPAVIIAASTHKDAANAFLDYLRSDAGQAELTKHGFVNGDPQTGNLPK